MDEVSVRPTWTTRFLKCVLVLATAVYCPLALPHGSVVDDDDQCLMSVGFYRAHFTIYQPRTAGHEEFCEDLPDVGETVFVIDYLHDSMREVPFDFRVVRDRHGIGRFARYEDVLRLDLARDTVFYKPPTVQADAVYTVGHHFLEPGGYIGVISVEHPTSDEVYRAVFPFEVGRFPWEWTAGALFLIGLVALLLRRSLWPWFVRRRAGGREVGP